MNELDIGDQIEVQTTSKGEDGVEGSAYGICIYECLTKEMLENQTTKIVELTYVFKMISSTGPSGQIPAKKGLKITESHESLALSFSKGLITILKKG